MGYGAVVTGSDAFRTSTPFPWFVAECKWNADFLHALAGEFPDCDDSRWITYPDPKEYGKRAGAANMWGPLTCQFMEILRSDAIVHWLEQLTGISSLTADDTGGGMHMTCEGGRLDMHVDFNMHPTLPLQRRINLLVFLNDDWSAEWGGHLFLGENREVDIAPLFNRTVVFETSDHSWHGHPDPIIGDHRRKSIAMYYYAPQAAVTKSHSTVWMEQ